MAILAGEYFLCGIGGSGMSALAGILRAGGIAVRGSDRSFDQGGNVDLAAALRAAGVQLFPQDGSGIDAGLARLVVSTAVEPEVPDVRSALALGVPVVRRAELLAELFHLGGGIAVGGTSGKSTVVGMLGHILRQAGLAPTVVNGGVMLNSVAADGLGNAWIGKGGGWVIEADESDGSIALYRPQVAVVTTVSHDHLPLLEVQRLFADFLGRADVGAVLGVHGCQADVLRQAHPRLVTVGLAEDRAAMLRAEQVRPRPDGIDFTVDGQSFELAVPGRHNVLNALAAVAAAELGGVERGVAAAALRSFAGIARRLQTIGVSAAGVAVIDDFGHNPEKIAASLATLREFSGRLIVFYQPHGFRPTLMLKDGLIEAFAGGLGEDDLLLMPDIFYAGGTASREISSQDLLAGVAACGRRTRHCPSRDEALAWVVRNARPGDRVVVMGARDNTLTDFAHRLLAAL